MRHLSELKRNKDTRVHTIADGLLFFNLRDSLSLSSCNVSFLGKMRFRAIGIYVTIGAAIFVSRVRGTIDVNLSELEYLAARLDPFECRRLIAALHYTTYDLPKSLAAAERKVDEEIPCLRQLLHWNSSPAEGRGKTHSTIIHRLRQLNRDDLADWLGKTAFKQLGKDLDNAITPSFDELAEEEMETSTSFATTDSITWMQEENPWLPIDTVLMALVLGLLGTLLVLIVAIIVHTVKSNKN